MTIAEILAQNDVDTASELTQQNTPEIKSAQPELSQNKSEDKIQNLLQRKQEKIEQLNGKYGNNDNQINYWRKQKVNELGNMDDSISVINGNVYSNQNKIYNEDSNAHRQQITSDFVDSGYYWEPKDKTFRKVDNHEIIHGKIGGIYHGNLKDGYEKAGYFTVDADSGIDPETQLIQNYAKYEKPGMTGGYEPARDGINGLMLNDVDTAKGFEAYLHGGQQDLNGRKYLLGDRKHYEDKAGRSYTEIVKDGSIWGNAEGDTEKGMSLTDIAKIADSKDTYNHASSKNVKMDSDLLLQMLNTLKMRESSGNYSEDMKPGHSYIGGYQFGAMRLQDLGMVKKGTDSKGLNNPDNWTGKYGIKSKDDFLKNPSVQDKVALESIVDYMKKFKSSSKDMGDLIGKTFAAHLLGANGSKNLNRTDSNNTTGKEYYELGKNAYINYLNRPVTVAPEEEGWVDRTGTNIRGFTGSFARAAGDTAKIANDLFSAGVYGSAKYIWGYDDKTANRMADNVKVLTKDRMDKLENYIDGAQFLRNLGSKSEEAEKYQQEAFKNVEATDPSTYGNVNLHALWNMTKAAFASPEMSSKSLGYTIGFVTGIAEKATAKLAGKGIAELMSKEAARKVAEKALKESAKAEAKLATLKASGKAISEKTEQSLNKMILSEDTKKSASLLINNSTEALMKAPVKDKLKMFLVKNADDLHLGALMTEQDMDEYYDKYGERASIGHALLSLAGNYLGAKLEITGDKIALLGTKEGLSGFLKAIGKKRATKFVTGMISGGAKLAEGGLAELVVEPIQSAIQGFDSVYKDGNTTEALNRAFHDAVQGAAFGVAGGVHMASPRAASGIIGDTLDAIKPMTNVVKQTIKSTVKNQQDINPDNEVIDPETSKEMQEMDGKSLDTHLKDLDVLTAGDDLGAIAKRLKYIQQRFQNSTVTQEQLNIFNKHAETFNERVKEVMQKSMPNGKVDHEVLGSDSRRVKELLDAITEIDNDDIAKKYIDNLVNDEKFKRKASKEQLEDLKQALLDRRARSEILTDTMSTVRQNIIDTGFRGYEGMAKLFQQGDTASIQRFAGIEEKKRNRLLNTYEEVENDVKEYLNEIIKDNPDMDAIAVKKGMAYLTSATYDKGNNENLIKDRKALTDDYIANAAKLMGVKMPELNDYKNGNGWNYKEYNQAVYDAAKEAIKKYGEDSKYKRALESKNKVVKYAAAVDGKDGKFEVNAYELIADILNEDSKIKEQLKPSSTLKLVNTVSSEVHTLNAMVAKLVNGDSAPNKLQTIIDGEEKKNSDDGENNIYQGIDVTKEYKGDKGYKVIKPLLETVFSLPRDAENRLILPEEDDKKIRQLLQNNPKYIERLVEEKETELNANNNNNSEPVQENVDEEGMKNLIKFVKGEKVTDEVKALAKNNPEIVDKLQKKYINVINNKYMQSLKENKVIKAVPLKAWEKGIAEGATIKQQSKAIEVYSRIKDELNGKVEPKFLHERKMLDWVPEVGERSQDAKMSRIAAVNVSKRLIEHQNRLNHYKEIHEGLKATINGITRTFSKQYNAWRNQYSSLMDKKGKPWKAVEIAKNRIKEIEAEHRELAKEIEVVQSKLRGGKALLAKKRKELQTSLDKLKDGIKNIIKKIIMMLNGYKEDLQDLEKKQNKLDKEYKKHINTINMWNNRVNSLEKKIDNYEKKKGITELELEAKAKVRAINEQKEITTKLRKRIQVLKAKYQGAKIIESRLKNAYISPLRKGTGKVEDGLFDTQINDIAEADKKTESIIASVPVEYLGEAAKAEAETAADALKNIGPVWQDNLEIGTNENGKVIKANQQMMYRKAPARALIYTKPKGTDDDGGEVFKETALAMVLALKELLGSRGYEVPMTAEDVTNDYGVENVTPDVLEYYRKIGRPIKYLSDSVGKNTLKLMGLKRKKDSKVDNPKERYSMLEQSMGAHVIELGRELGLINVKETGALDMGDMLFKAENPEVSEKEISDAREARAKLLGDGAEGVKVVTFTVNKDVAVNAGKKFRELELELIVPANVAGPLYSKPNINGEIEIRRNSITKAPAMAQAHVKKIMDIEWYVKGIDDGNKKMEQLLKMNKNVLLKAMGYIDPEVLKGQTYTLRQSNISVNRDIEREIDGVLKVVDDIKEGRAANSIWFKWFISKNTRYMLDSAGANPQTGKKLARWLIKANRKVANINLNNKTDRTLLSLAIALSFGFDIDKESIEDSLKFVEELVKDNNYNNLMEQWQNLVNGNEMTEFNINGTKIGLKNIGHVADGLEALSLMHKAINDGSMQVKTTLQIETDAVTSGFGLKLLQYAADLDVGEVTVKEWLAKTGMFVDGTNEAFPDIVANGKLVDAYKTLAVALSDKAIDESITQQEDNKEEYKAADYGVGLREGYNWFKGLLKEMSKVVDGITIVTPEARALLKPPFMTFQYGAGFVKNIKEMTDVIMAKVEKEVLNSGSLEDVEQMLKAFGVDDNAIDLMNYAMKNDWEGYVIDTENGKTLGEVMRKTVTDSYGTVVEQVLKDKFEHIIEINKAVNSAMKIAYDVWNMKAMQKLEEMAKKGTNVGITKDMIEKVFADKELMKYFPVIAGPLSEGIEDSIAIFKERLLDSLFRGNDILSKDKLGRGVAFKIQDGKPQQISYSALKKWLAEAGAAGGVIPIHTLDAAIMGAIADKYGVLEVHDAIIMGLASVEDIVREYNKRVILVSKKWNYLGEVSKTLERVLDLLTDEELEEVVSESENDPKKVLTELWSYAQSNEKFRKELYSKHITIQHMVLTKESGYEYYPNAKANDKIKEDIMKAYNKLPLVLRNSFGIKDDIKGC